MTSEPSGTPPPEMLRAGSGAVRCESGRNGLEVEAKSVHRRLNDRTIQPDCERFLAKRMGATTTEAASSHVVMLSQPQVVIDVIRKAVKAVQGAAATA